MSDIELRDVLEKVSRKHEILANPYRLLILAILYSHKEISWSRLVEFIEEVLKLKVNPNAINFHLTRLIEAELLTKSILRRNTIYKVTPRIEEFKGDLEEIIKLLETLNF